MYNTTPHPNLGHLARIHTQDLSHHMDMRRWEQYVDTVLLGKKDISARSETPES